MNFLTIYGISVVIIALFMLGLAGVQHLANKYKFSFYIATLLYLLLLGLIFIAVGART